MPRRPVGERVVEILARLPLSELALLVESDRALRVEMRNRAIRELFRGRYAPAGAGRMFHDLSSRRTTAADEEILRAKALGAGKIGADRIRQIALDGGPAWPSRKGLEAKLYASHVDSDPMR